MHNSWLQLVDCVLRPARPRLEPCLQEREQHRAAGRRVVEEQARALADCRNRIEQARAAVFAADDGVIPAQMTKLEREWRALSRFDAEAGLMELWARVAPMAWIDRKRWRDSDAGAMVDAATALAADAEGVEAAEAAVGSLRVALAPWGVQLGSRVRWRAFEGDAACVSELLAEPERVAREAVAKRDAGPIMLERAERLECAVREAASTRFPERPLLVQSLARAAFVDELLRAAALADRPNPVSPLRQLWQAGYHLATFHEAGVTLEIPPLP
jgi:hypothetical protein